MIIRIFYALFWPEITYFRKNPKTVIRQKKGKIMGNFPICHKLHENPEKGSSFCDTGRRFISINIDFC